MTFPGDPGPGYRDASYEEEQVDHAIEIADRQYNRCHRLYDKIANHPNLNETDFWENALQKLDTNAAELADQIEEMVNTSPYEQGY